MPNIQLTNQGQETHGDQVGYHAARAQLLAERVGSAFNSPAEQRDHLADTTTAYDDTCAGSVAS